MITLRCFHCIWELFKGAFWVTYIFILLFLVAKKSAAQTWISWLSKTFFVNTDGHNEHACIPWCFSLWRNSAHISSCCRHCAATTVLILPPGSTATTPTTTSATATPGTSVNSRGTKKYLRKLSKELITDSLEICIEAKLNSLSLLYCTQSCGY